jgi:hypothetical protein
MTTEKLIDLYNEGAITQYELFATSRDLGIELLLPENLQESFKIWDAEHPKDKCLTFFSIVANKK